MRYVSLACLLLLAAPILASDPVNPDPAFETRAWTGKHSDELIAEWGKPRKTKRDGKDGKVLVYRLRFFGEEVFGTTKISWSDAGIGPSPVTDDETATFRCRAQCPGGMPLDMTFAGGPKVIATQKVKFYVDREGIIQRQEFAPRKWKKKKP